MNDFNAFDSSGNAFRDSLYNARGRNALFLGAAISQGTITFPAGIIGDSIRFLSDAPAPGPIYPDTTWNMAMLGEPDDGWGSESFTIRLWWQGGGLFKSVFGSTFAITTFNIPRYTGTIVAGLYQLVNVPSLRFKVNNAISLGQVQYNDFFQSPNTSVTGVPPGTTDGIVGPVVEMSVDTWHRIVVWYDKDTLEIGLQLDDLAAQTGAASGAINHVASAGFQSGDFTPENIVDNSFDEIGLWHNYVWTSGERAADWNAGAGTGWPDVLSTISKAPMGYWRFADPEDITPEGIASLV